MNTRPLNRRFTSVIGGAALALGMAATCTIVPVDSASAAPLVTEVGAGCTVSDASLSWGVIERWRSYITGTIANGNWTLSDGVEYETPEFRWAGGAGELDSNGVGEIAFAGGVHFSGHEELLQLDVAHPTFEFVSPTEAYLLLDLTSTKPTGEPDVALPQVRAVKLDLAGAVTADGTTLEVTEAPGRLTAEGASAFGGFYAAGEEVDPVSLTASAPGCALAAGAAGEGGASAPTDNAVDPGDQQMVIQEAPEVPWLPIGIGAAALIVIAGASIALLRGRKPGAAVEGAAPASEVTETDAPDAGTETRAETGAGTETGEETGAGTESGEAPPANTNT